MNPVTVATFFHETCRGIFDYLLRAGSSDGGLFGPVSTYFGTVETNGRGMLHLHCLVWLKGMSSFSDLRRKIVDEDGFKAWLLSFLDQVIRCELTPVNTDKVLPEVGPSAAIAGEDEASSFISRLKDNANLVASRVQMYSRNHNATCFKYGRNKTQCRFNFSRPIIPDFYIDNKVSIFLRQNNVWVNPWNPAFASILHTNHDITFVVSFNNALAFIHYITNYATKGDCSQYQRIMGAAFVKKAYDEVQSTANITTQVEPDKFALRAFNRLAYDREISGPLVASYLLGLPDHYTLSNNVKFINLALFCKQFPEFAPYTYEAMADVDDLVRLWRQTSAPSTMFDHYWGRSSKLQNFCLFVYICVISIYPRKLAISGDIEFASSHLNSLTHVQRHFTKSGSQAEVKLLGPLFDNDGVGKIIPVDGPETPEGLNNIAVILLVLFVPWDRL